MTLHTRITIVEPTPVREVFDVCRRLIGGEHAQFRHENGSYCNEISQGLPALLWIEYGTDAPLVPDSEYVDDPDGRGYFPPVDEWSIVVHFDTAYVYQYDNGAGCDDLHAWLVQQLGAWLRDRGLSWYWYHEYAGARHPSTDSVVLLGDPDRGELPSACLR